MFRTAPWQPTLFLGTVYLLSSLAYADYEAGRAAWDAGRPLEAVSEWRAAADQGDARAMLALGQAYVRGLGIPQDYVEAHMWLNLAAARGDPQAPAERDALAGDMTAEQRAEAQRQAREWEPGGQETAAAPNRDVDAGSPPERALREAQALLAELGYKPGPADGAWGQRSAQAYQAFLGDAGLPMTDQLTPKALLAMREMAAGEGQDKQPEVAAALVPADALHRAVTAGDVDGLETALRTGLDVNARDGRGWTALMHAADKGYLLLVPPLLKAKADPDIQAPDGATALFMAAVLGHSEIIELLMKAGADIGIRGPRGRTAVDVAQMTYGPVAEALAEKENAAVVALLRGITTAANAALPPGRRCSDDADDAGCWREILENPGCHLWVESAKPNRTRESWSGSCDDGAATGRGTLVTRWQKGSVLEETVTIVDGRRHGKATARATNGFVTEGQYDRGVAYGRWISYGRDGECFSVRELSGDKIVSYDSDCSNYIEPRNPDR